MGVYFVLTIIVLIGMLIYSLVKDKEELGVGTLGLIIILIIGYLFSLCVPNPDGYYEDSVVKDEYKLKTVLLNKKPSGEIHGSIFYMDGFIKTETDYKFYIDYGNKHYKLETLKCNDVILVESPDTPKVVKHYYTRGYITHGKIYKYFRGNIDTTDVVGVKHYKQIELYIPEGTIIEDYSQVNL